MEYVIEFARAPQLVGPFHSESDAEDAAAVIAAHRSETTWRIRAVANGALARAEAERFRRDDTAGD